MEQVEFKRMRKKDERLFIKISPFEKEKIKEFCRQHQITISDLGRYGISIVMKKQSQGK